MSLRIATNTQALSSQRYLGLNKLQQDKALERLASGSRINRAGDDAAGLAISEKLKANIRSMEQATRNANDGISMIQVAEGAMNETSNILVRLRELSIQAASDTIGNSERSFVNKEVQQLKAEIERISSGTEFNGHHLLDGTTAALEIQVGVHNDPTQDRLVFESQNLITNLTSLDLTEVDVMAKEGAQGALNKIDFAINKVNENRASLGALQNRLGSTINNLQIYHENLSAANSRIRDTDIAEESSNMVKYNILSQSNIAMLGQANQNPQMALKLL